MTPEQIAAAVAFFIMVSGAMWAIWWRIEGKVDAARKDAQATASTAQMTAMLAREELSKYMLHVSETFATKAGMQEQTTQLLRAIEGVGNRIDGLHERLDRAFETRPVRRTS
ncbi:MULTISPECIES: hypothetical protein [unclassified Mesorhizobium]|uniref:hypothetical protein n=1 Tax=unclassified Mesorhizobium TaxID=325217 RepID=UPI0011288ADE|nr:MULTISPECIES: hypothetical protein [unclassified Mesorhizobium]TPJ86972.1 hypothetical protein FJ489_30970 [Mesorhizobium sp. B2-5-12]TPK19195.1 hypothetical protein FJ562_31375 [Mesorhizobium sp. B2-5-6]